MRVNRTTVRALGGIAAVCIVAAACSSESSPTTPNASSTTGTADLGLIKSGVIQVVSTPASPPLTFVKDGKLQGMGVDIANEVAKRLGVKVEYHEMDFKGIVPAVNTHQYDMGIVFTFVTDERKKQVDFTIPWNYASFAILTDKSTGLTTMDQLAGKTVAVGANNQESAHFAEYLPNSKPRQFDSAGGMYTALQGGLVDAIVDNSSQVPARIADNPDLQIIKVLDNGDPGAFPVYKGSPELTKAFDRELNAMFDDGTWAEIYKHWAHGVPIPPPLVSAHPSLTKYASAAATS